MSTIIGNEIWRTRQRLKTSSSTTPSAQRRTIHSTTLLDNFLQKFTVRLVPNKKFVDSGTERLRASSIIFNHMECELISEKIFPDRNRTTGAVGHSTTKSNFEHLDRAITQVLHHKSISVLLADHRKSGERDGTQKEERGRYLIFVCCHFVRHLSKLSGRSFKLFRAKLKPVSIGALRRSESLRNGRKNDKMRRLCAESGTV
jgi:hypothetical protein